MKTRFLFSTVAVLAFATAAQAATVTITVSSAGAVPKFVDSLGSFLLTGDSVRVGIFNSSTPANLSTLMNSNVYADVNALFTPLAENNAGGGTVTETGAAGTNLVINNLFGGSGSVFGQIEGIDSAFCTPGTELAVWVFNNADPTQATEWGIFTTTNGWEFPASGALGGSSTLATNEIDTILRGSAAGSNFSLSSISVVPEPGSWLLLITGVLVLNSRRRRRVKSFGSL